MAGGRGREARVGGVKSPRLTVRRCGAGGWCGGCCFASAALLVLVLAFWGAFAQNRPEESPRVGSRSAESPKCSTGGAVPWPYFLVQKISIFVHPKWRGRIRALLDLIDSSFSLLARLVARTNAPLPPAGVDSLWMKVNPISSICHNICQYHNGQYQTSKTSTKKTLPGRPVRASPRTSLHLLPAPAGAEPGRGRTRRAAGCLRAADQHAAGTHRGRAGARGLRC